MFPLIFVVLTIAVLQILHVTSLSLTIRPGHVRVSDDPQSVSFTCAAELSITGCQFKWWDGRHNKRSPLLELSQGSQSQADPTHLDTSLTGYSYSGRGLEAGDCGVSLQVAGYNVWMVACRVRAESGGWRYAMADLYTTNRHPLPYNLMSPREVVVLPGGEARFSLKTKEHLDTCYFFLPKVSDELDFDEGATSDHSTGRHRYLGAGLQSGECGLALTHIREADNGPVRFWIRTPTYKAESKLIALIVARPPTAPILSLRYMGNNLTAICKVKEGRPVAMISWVLGDVIIRQDEDDDTQAGPHDEWRWPWMQGSIQQILTLQLQPQHSGKFLKCRVSHIALAQYMEATITVSFTEPSTTPHEETSTVTDPSV